MQKLLVDAGVAANAASQRQFASLLRVLKALG
jgi:hypothetical protein